MAKLWDSQNGRQIRELIGHSDQITQVGFAPDGHTALTGSDDLSARLWNVETGQELRRFVGQRGTLLFAGFSPGGDSVVTGDGANAYIWHTKLDDVTSFTCNHLVGDLNPVQKERYAISDSTPTCTEFAQRSLQPTWTPVDPNLAVRTPVTLAAAQAPAPASVTMEFVNELANVAMGIAVTDVFIDVGNGQVMRTRDINAETLALPVYTSSDVTFDYEVPVEMGPFPIGKPLGFTLGDYLAAKGQGTYTVHGDHATLTMTFENLVPNGVYTVWCNEFDPAHPNAGIERPCGAADGSENSFVADAQGHGQKQMDIAILPPSTPDLLQEIGIAYHSDGNNNGTASGIHGVNVHGQLWFDFLPPGFVPPTTALNP